MTGIGVLFRGLKVESMIQYPTRNRLYIGHLGVKPELRGQEIGRALIQQMCEMAKEKNIQYLSLDVATKNSMAQTLYEELGFVVKALRPFKYQQPSKQPVSNHHYMEYLIK